MVHGPQTTLFSLASSVVKLWYHEVTEYVSPFRILANGTFPLLFSGRAREFKKKTHSARPSLMACAKIVLGQSRGPHNHSAILL